jgi:hypothetical protein
MKKQTLPPPPETRTVVLSMKIRKSMADALEKAAKANSRSKNALVETVMEQWLRDGGFLK